MMNAEKNRRDSVIARRAIGSKANIEKLFHSGRNVRLNGHIFIVGPNAIAGPPDISL